MRFSAIRRSSPRTLCPTTEAVLWRATTSVCRFRSSSRKWPCCLPRTEHFRSSFQADSHKKLSGFAWKTDCTSFDVAKSTQQPENRPAEPCSSFRGKTGVARCKRCAWLPMTEPEVSNTRNSQKTSIYKSYNGNYV